MRLGRHARDLGFVVRVKSNGHALGREMAKRLKAEVDPFVVEVSLHGARPRPTTGRHAWREASSASSSNIAEMKAAGLRVQLNSTLTAWNEAEIDEMFALADQLGTVLQVDPEVTPRDDGDRSPFAIMASRDGLLRLFDIQARRASRQGSRGLPATGRRGRPRRGNTAVRGRRGSRWIRMGTSIPACSGATRWEISTRRLSERSGGTRRSSNAVRRISGDVKRVVEGEEDGALMSFCPGTAAAVTGSPLGIYPQAARRGALNREAAKRRVPLRVLPD